MSTNELANKAAYRLAARPLKEGFQFEALHEYTDQDGQILYWRIRLKNPSTGDKWIRPMRLDGAEKYELKEPIFKNGKPLYNLHALSLDKEAPVVLCEGEWCVDKLSQFGILATTSGSADSASKADWETLSGRTVMVWRDYDDAGLRYATTAIAQLQKIGCKVSQIQVEQLDLPPKGDAVDWLGKNPNATTQDILSLPRLELVNEAKANSTVENDTEENEGNKQSQASALVDFVLANTELFHDQNREVYAQDSTTRETRNLNSTSFKDWLVANFYELTQKVARDQSVREALSTLSGLARHKGECRDVHIRTALYQDAYYIDLAEPGQNRAICITQEGWKIVTDHPIRFLRHNTLHPLPEPKDGSDISKLWSIINIPGNCQLLIIAWLIEALRPDTPFPVLELIGEQGCAKSTTQSMLRQLIDPNACNLRAAPKAVEDVFVNAGMNWLVSYENISYLSASMQDALCVISTGAGFAKRKLYSNADEDVIIVNRPIVLNGISAAITSQDLIDRTISIEMPVIKARVVVKTLRSIFEAEYPYFLGALFTIFSQALEYLPDIELPPKDRPRLIEFVYLGMAVAKAMGKDENEFLSQFNESRLESIARTIEANSVASAVIEWFQGKQKSQAIRLPAKDLLSLIENSNPGYKDNWPRTAKAFGDHLRRAAPALRQMGIECLSLGKKGSYVLWEVKPCDN